MNRNSDPAAVVVGDDERREGVVAPNTFVDGKVSHHRQKRAPERAGRKKELPPPEESPSSPTRTRHESNRRREKRRKTSTTGKTTTKAPEIKGKLPPRSSPHRHRKKKKSPRSSSDRNTQESSIVGSSRSHHRQQTKGTTNNMTDKRSSCKKPSAPPLDFYCEEAGLADAAAGAITTGTAACDDNNDDGGGGVADDADHDENNNNNNNNNIHMIETLVSICQISHSRAQSLLDACPNIERAIELHYNQKQQQPAAAAAVVSASAESAAARVTQQQRGNSGIEDNSSRISRSAHDSYLDVFGPAAAVKSPGDLGTGEDEGRTNRERLESSLSSARGEMQQSKETYDSSEKEAESASKKNETMTEGTSLASISPNTNVDECGQVVVEQARTLEPPPSPEILDDKTYYDKGKIIKIETLRAITNTTNTMTDQHSQLTRGWTMFDHLPRAEEWGTGMEIKDNKGKVHFIISRNESVGVKGRIPEFRLYLSDTEGNVVAFCQSDPSTFKPPPIYTCFPAYDGQKPAICLEGPDISGGVMEMYLYGILRLNAWKYRGECFRRSVPEKHLYNDHELWFKPVPGVQCGYKLVTRTTRKMYRFFKRAGGSQPQVDDQSAVITRDQREDNLTIAPGQNVLVCICLTYLFDRFCKPSGNKRERHSRPESMLPYYGAAFGAVGIVTAMAMDSANAGRFNKNIRVTNLKHQGYPSQKFSSKYK